MQLDLTYALVVVVEVGNLEGRGWFRCGGEAAASLSCNGRDDFTAPQSAWRGASLLHTASEKREERKAPCIFVLLASA
jgi:hypothetical protein